MRWNLLNGLSAKSAIYATRGISATRIVIVVLTCVLVISIGLSIGCRERYREDLDYSYGVEQTWPVDELPEGEFVQFESVFWEPDDTTSYAS